jgi:hypothetical protein
MKMREAMGGVILIVLLNTLGHPWNKLVLGSDLVDLMTLWISIGYDAKAFSYFLLGNSIQRILMFSIKFFDLHEIANQEVEIAPIHSVVYLIWIFADILFEEYENKRIV